MQTLRLLVFLFAASCCLGAAPDSVSDHVIYLSQSPMHGSYTQAFSLRGDGRSTALFTWNYLYPGPEVISYPSGSSDYTYRKIDDVSAELVLAGERYTLHFDSARGPLAGGAYRGENPPPTYPVGYLYGFRLALIPTQAPLVNCSNRSFVRSGDSAFTGFVITDQNPRFVLVRAVGPGLAQFGVTGLLANPRLRVTWNNAVQVANEDWRTSSIDAIRNTNAIVGAFPLSTSSADSAVILLVGPGSYVAEVSSSIPTDAGQVLMEVYLLP